MNDKAVRICDQTIAYCLCFLIFCLPFAKAGIGIFTAFAFLLWILKRILGYRTNGLWGMIPKTELNRALGIFILINVISVIFSVDYGLSLRGFFCKELKFIVIFFMVIEVINSKQRLRYVLITTIASAALMVADAGVQYFRGADFLRGYYGARLSASFSAANLFAGWLIVIIPLFLGLLATDKVRGKILKTLLSILIILLLVCLIMTYSRGGWLGFIIGISLMFGYFFKKLSSKTRLSCLLICVSLLTLFLVLPQSLRNKVTAIGNIDLKYSMTINERIKLTLKNNVNDFPVRLNLWKESLRIIKGYPFVGCGLNTYSKVARDYKSFEHGGMYPHNCYLQRAAETGLLGLFTFLWVLFIFFKTGLRHLKKRRDALVLGLLSGILAFLVQAFFDTHLYSLQLVVLFWFMLGLTIAVIKLERVSLQ